MDWAIGKNTSYPGRGIDTMRRKRDEGLLGAASYAAGYIGDGQGSCWSQVRQAAGGRPWSGVAVSWKGTSGVTKGRMVARHRGWVQLVARPHASSAVMRLVAVAMKLIGREELGTRAGDAWYLRR